MLSDDIKAQMLQALKARRGVEKEILRVLLGEIQTVAARGQTPLSDDDVIAIVRKLIKSNEESKELSNDADVAATLGLEIDILKRFLPKTLDVEDIVTALGPVSDSVRGSKSEGQAIGVAMKHLKATGAAVTGTLVASAVQRMRGSS